MDDKFKSPLEPVRKRRSDRRRSLSDEEHRLWRAVVRDTRPLSAGKIVPDMEQEDPLSEPDKSDRPAKSVPQPQPIPAIPRARPNSVLLDVVPTVPPLTGLDRRTSQRLARGQIEAEARLDLHGLRQSEAHGVLYRFLSRCRREGMRCVLVITGKGESPFSRHTLHGSRFHEATDHSGVLRSALPQWLNESQFRAEVAGFQPAHPKHGGGGAFYIWLRKRT